MINADKLKAKMSETIISSAPAAFSSEYSATSSGVYPVAEVKPQLADQQNTDEIPARSNK